MSSAMILRAALLTLIALPAVAQDGIPAQDFTLDPSHTSVTFSVPHLGFSQFTAGFDTVAGTLTLDPAAPATASVSVTVDVASLDLPSPPPGFRDELLSPTWLDAAAHPQMTFRADGVTLTGDRAATLDGTLTFRGIAQPQRLEATFNGGWPGPPYEPAARIGFSATGTLSRTAFAMGAGVPPPGSTLGVGDIVTLRIESEWSGTVRP